MYKSNTASLKRLEKQLENKQRVRGGVLSNQEYENGTSLLEVAFTQEFGSKQIPARSFVRSTFDENVQTYKNMVKGYLKNGLAVSQILEIVGVKLAGDIQEKISSIQNPPLSQKTIERRKNKTTKPLVATGTLLSSISYEVYDVNS